MELHLKIVGCLMVLLSLLHIIILRYFNWQQALSSLTLIDKQIMYVHTFFIALVVLLMGVLCLESSADIVETSFGNKIALGLFLFWFTRLLFQFFVYSPKVWRGKRLETVVHIIFSMLWLYVSGVFLIVFLSKHFI